MQFPTELLNQIAVALEVAVACMTALLVAFWIGLAIWTFRDIRARTRDLFAWLLATLLVLVTGPVGLLLYLLLRPRETLAQSYDRQLEEEALLRDITTRRACPSCQAVTEPDWLICPQCRTELRRACEQCGRPLELNWKVCPYCGAPVVKAIEVKSERAALPVGSGYAALERGDHEMPAEPATTTASDSTTELLPEAEAEQEPTDEQ
jgi:RNA polymerase subunit RPABC4/transcription elongation factor Spt4